MANLAGKLELTAETFCDTEARNKAVYVHNEDPKCNKYRKKIIPLYLKTL